LKLQWINVKMSEPKILQPISGINTGRGAQSKHSASYAAAAYLHLYDPQKTLGRRRRPRGSFDMAEVEVAAAASATTPEVAAATEGAGAAEAKGPHKLHRQWTFWFDIQSKPKPGAAWGTSLKKACTFDTVEEFWRYMRCSGWHPSPRIPPDPFRPVWI
jgi:hypothetical protein